MSAHLVAGSCDGGALLDPVLSEVPARVWEEVAAAFAEVRSLRKANAT